MRNITLPANGPAVTSGGLLSRPVFSARASLDGFNPATVDISGDMGAQTREASKGSSNEVTVPEGDELATPRCGAVQSSGEGFIEDPDEETPQVHAADITLDTINDEDIPFLDLSEFDCK